MERYEQFLARHPRIKWGSGLSGGLLAIVGLSSLPSDLENWNAAFQGIGSELGRWILVVVGLGVVVAVLVTRRVTPAQVQSEAPPPTRPPTYDDFASMRVPVDEPNAAKSEPVSQHGGRVYGGAAVGVAIRQREEKRRKEAAFLAVEVEIALAHEEALEMTKMLRAEGPHQRVEAAVVKVKLPDWRTKTTEFIGVVLGSAHRAAFKGAATGDSVLESLESEAKFLSELGLKLTPDSIRASEEQVRSARTKRRDNETASFLIYDPATPDPVPLAGQLDSLLRNGIDLLVEMSVPVEPKVTNGVLRVDGEEAPGEWWEKADAFHQEIRSLLADRHPALLTVFAEGFNGHFQKRQADQEARKQNPVPDRRSTTEKVLDMATFERSGPASTVEASLDGLAAARHRLGARQAQALSS